MKRFIDLRQHHDDLGGRFAWWDTVIDAFERFAGVEVWDTWEDFASCYSGEELERYRKLTPAWAFLPSVKEPAGR